MPAVLCELGFLTNRDEVRKIKSSSYRQRLADAVAAGIRSMKACNVMRSLEFTNLVDLKGGFRAWEAAGNKVAK